MTILKALKIKKRLLILMAIFVAGHIFTSCNNQQNVSVINDTYKRAEIEEKKSIREIIGKIKIEKGEFLERDIIPKLAEVFSLSESNVKKKLSEAKPSRLINDKISDFRRMEGIILPGEYWIYKDNTLENLILEFIEKSEKRYTKLIRENNNKNKLKPFEQLILASIIEAECLSGKNHKEVATVFLNRLDAGDKLQSCVTSEYAIGYQRAYLLSKDIQVKSEYNTYYAKTLPLGPICSINKISLEAAISEKIDSEIYFFYYDYISNELFFYEDYKAFVRAANKSRNNFDEKSKIGKREKINKQKNFLFDKIVKLTLRLHF